MSVAFVSTRDSGCLARDSDLLSLQWPYGLRAGRTPDQVIRVPDRDRVIVLCSWARHFTLTVPLSTQEYKWDLENCQGNWTKYYGFTTMG